MRYAKPTLVTLAVLAILALVIRQVTQAVRRTFTPPAGLAQINSTSPRTQNGLTLVEIDKIGPVDSYSFNVKSGMHDVRDSQAPTDDTGIWIQMPPDYGLPQNCLDSWYAPCADRPSVLGRTSTGESFPLTWHVSGDADTPRNPTYLLAAIPAGYSNDVHWVDVTLDDKHGAKAMWRITHLPPSRHVLLPPIHPQTTFHQGAITARAAAYRGSDPNGNLKGPALLCDIAGTVNPSPHQWQLGPMTLTREWEPPGYVPISSGNSWGTEKKNGAVRFESNGDPVYATQPQPYLNDTHWVRLTAELQEFETCDEMVTFHNLSVFKMKNGGQYLVGSGPQTVTTPSGVTVTLDDVQHKPNLNSSWGGDGYSLHLLYPQTTLQPSLPRSPLWRKYKGLVRISADIPKPYDSGGSSYGNTEGTYHFRTDRPLPPTLPAFRVIIRQRVDLTSVPMTFTLPVGSQPPKTPL